MATDEAGLPAEAEASSSAIPPEPPSTSIPAITQTQDDSSKHPDTQEAAAGAGAEPPKMSKQAQKRKLREEKWEATREDRLKRRKEKRRERKGRQREHRQSLIAQGADPKTVIPRRGPSDLVPVALVLDCDFEQYMSDKERISLSSQVTRSYSDNRLARYRAHLWIAGWRGALRERFRVALGDMHLGWNGVGFTEGGLVECAAQAREQLKTQGGEMIGPLRRSAESANMNGGGVLPMVKDETDPFPKPDPEPAPNEECRDVVYLTSDSPYTLDRLEANTIYVVGGLVDKNREKGLCYRRARELGIRTARLPIGQYMVMSSRKILATNHVVDIMLKWLEYEDWGEAFSKVIPKRKGGQLRRDVADGDKVSEAKEGTEAAGDEESKGDVEGKGDGEGKNDEDSEGNNGSLSWQEEDNVPTQTPMLAEPIAEKPGS